MRYCPPLPIRTILTCGGRSAQVSHERYRFGGPWLPPSSGLTPRGISAPIGTGAYKAVSKLIVNSRDGTTRELLAKDFNATCFVEEKCDYGEGQYVSELHLKKHPDHWRKPNYDYVILRAYESNNDIKLALQVHAFTAEHICPAHAPMRLIPSCAPERHARHRVRCEHDLAERLRRDRHGGGLALGVAQGASAPTPPQRSVMRLNAPHDTRY